jgi:isoleucyl-tRNA synthetase
VVAPRAEKLEIFKSLIAEELNVKAVELVELSIESASDYGVVKRLTVNSRAAGPRIGKAVQSVIAAAKANDWSETPNGVRVGDVELIEGEFEISLVADSSGNSAANLIGMLPGGGFVILDGETTPELEAEGLARDLIRVVQQARKDADFDVSDRIQLHVVGSAAVLDAAQTHRDLIASETLSVEVQFELDDQIASELTVGDNLPVSVLVAKS